MKKFIPIIVFLMLTNIINSQSKLAVSNQSHVYYKSDSLSSYEDVLKKDDS